LPDVTRSAAPIALTLAPPPPPTLTGALTRLKVRLMRGLGVRKAAPPKLYLVKESGLVPAAPRLKPAETKGARNLQQLLARKTLQKA
jgi:hypothetical protein